MKQTTWKDLLDSISEIENTELNSRILEYAAKLSCEERMQIIRILASMEDPI